MLESLFSKVACLYQKETPTQVFGNIAKFLRILFSMTPPVAAPPIKLIQPSLSDGLNKSRYQEYTIALCEV